RLRRRDDACRRAAGDDQSPLPLPLIVRCNPFERLRKGRPTFYWTMERMFYPVEGDLVIVERGREPKGGDIVIAEVDGEWTMKHFRREGKTVVLEAANPKYPPIRPREELKLGGVVTAVIRKYL
ncbi:MAG: S24 family peptidase, partial [Syntrophales bacterium]|nr:S24 family peptidase [Syntrophales bacterium]